MRLLLLALLLPLTGCDLISLQKERVLMDKIIATEAEIFRLDQELTTLKDRMEVCVLECQVCTVSCDKTGDLIQEIPNFLESK